MEWSGRSTSHQVSHPTICVCYSLPRRAFSVPPIVGSGSIFTTDQTRAGDTYGSRSNVLSTGPAITHCGQVVVTIFSSCASVHCSRLYEFGKGNFLDDIENSQQSPLSRDPPFQKGRPGQYIRRVFATINIHFVVIIIIAIPLYHHCGRRLPRSSGYPRNNGWQVAAGMTTTTFAGP